MIENKISVIRRELGTKSKSLVADFDASDLWSSVSSLLAMIEEQGNPIVPPVTARLGQREEKKIRIVESSLGLVGRQLDKFEHALESAGVQMNLAVQAVGNRIDALEQEPVGRQGPGGSNVDEQKMEEGFREVFERITNLDKAVKEVKSESSPGMVKFGSLGISSLKEAGAWVDANIDSASVGLIIDPHTLM